MSGRRGRDFFKQREKAFPRALVFALVAVLRGVAAGGVDQHGFVGEPPVAVARAAHAADRARAELVGQRERQARIDQRGGLAGAGRADEDVPGQVVEVVAAREREPVAPARLLAGRVQTHLLERGNGLGKAGVEDLRLAVVGCFGLGGRRLHEAVGQVLAGLARAPAPPNGAQHDDEHDDADQHAAREFGFERCQRADPDERADPPDQERDDDERQCGEQHRVKEKAEDLFHRVHLAITVHRAARAARCRRAGCGPGWRACRWAPRARRRPCRRNACGPDRPAC